MDKIVNLSFKKGLNEIFPAKMGRRAERERAFYRVVEHVGRVNKIGERSGDLKPAEIRDVVDLHKKNGFGLFSIEFFRKAESTRLGISRKFQAKKAADVRWRKKSIKKR